MVFLFSNTSFKLHNTKTNWCLTEHNVLGKTECLSFLSKQVLQMGNTSSRKKKKKSITDTVSISEAFWKLTGLISQFHHL